MNQINQKTRQTFNTNVNINSLNDGNFENTSDLIDPSINSSIDPSKSSTYTTSKGNLTINPIINSSNYSNSSSNFNNHPEYRTITSNENMLNTSINTLTSEMGKPHQSSLSFGLTSKRVQEEERKRREAIESLARTVNSFMNDEELPVDEHGRRLINFDSNKEWFFNNITFIFVEGMVFDEEDTERMNGVLSCFQDLPNKAYLNNRYLLLNYDDEVAMAIENKIGIENGNYHIMMGVINQAGAEQIKTAPMVCFRQSGLLYCETKWETIETRMSGFVSNFGLIYEDKGKGDIHGIKNQQRITRENYFDLDPAVSAMEIMNTKVEDFPRGQEKEYYEYNRRENMRVGRAFTQNQRGSRVGDEEFRMKSGRDLYSRIENDRLTSIPAREKGGVMKMDLYYLPRESQQAEYILYKDDEGYNVTEGNNVVSAINPTAKTNMPQFGNKNYKGQNNRRVVGTQPVFPK